MNALNVDYWIWVLGNGFKVSNIDSDSKEKIKELFSIMDVIESMGDDDRKEIWIKAEKPSYEDYESHYYPDGYDDDIDKDAVLQDYQDSYPYSYKWYKLLTVKHENCANELNEDFYGIFLDGEYILAINDPNQEGWPLNVSDLLEFLIEESKSVINMLKAGTYNLYVERDLPKENMYGLISRKDYWDIYPDQRKACHEYVNWDVIREFIDLYNASGCKVPLPDEMYTDITARDYYEACDICYKSCEEYEKKEQYWFIDTEEEHKRYGGLTPKEHYYMRADGRDDGLKNVPIDSSKDFKDWLNQTGDYYEFNGHHPWEIRSSGSISYSIHLYVVSEKVSDGERYYFSLSGNKYITSFETVRYYIALRNKRIPVYLYDADRIAARFMETDMLAVVPNHYNLFLNNTVWLEGSEHDAVQLCNERMDEMIAKTKWFPEKEAVIKQTNEPR